jgi:hypothetical protein
MTWSWAVMTLENIVLKSYFKGKRGKNPCIWKDPHLPKKIIVPLPLIFRNVKYGA